MEITVGASSDEGSAEAQLYGGVVHLPQGGNVSQVTISDTAADIRAGSGQMGSATAQVWGGAAYCGYGLAVWNESTLAGNQVTVEAETNGVSMARAWGGMLYSQGTLTLDIVAVIPLVVGGGNPTQSTRSDVRR